ncbi:hypothetical protein MN608_10434 [Microdochium nivale]|nr:hypothetical protein MN608_10434 [Microdochium nivale]
MKTSATLAFCSLGAFGRAAVSPDTVSLSTTATPTTGLVTVVIQVTNTGNTGTPIDVTATSATGPDPGQGGTTTFVVHTVTPQWITKTQSDLGTGTSTTIHHLVPSTTTTTTSSTPIPAAAGALPTVGLSAKALVAGAAILAAAL